jgi:uncharacterized membrane protein
LSAAGSVLAELAILGAAVSYAFASLFGRRFRQMGIDPIATATGQVTASSLMLVPIALLVDRPLSLPMPGLATIVSIGAIAAFSTALGYILYFRILAGAGVTKVVLVTLLAPASSILLGALFLHKRLAPRHFVGLALIGLGLACIDGRLFRAFRAAGSARGRWGVSYVTAPDSLFPRGRAMVPARQERNMGIERKKPLNVAERAAHRRAKRPTLRQAEDMWRRETYCLPRPEAREKALEWFDLYPKAAYMTEIEFWRELADGRIEFTIRRLPSAD